MKLLLMAIAINVFSFMPVMATTMTSANNCHQVAQQDTIYLDEKGEEQKTSAHDLSKINSKEIIQIGYFTNDQNVVQVAKMPWTVEKVPPILPTVITSLHDMFETAVFFNQDISGWDVSHVTDMSSLFWGSAFNQNINGWDVSHVTDMSYMFCYALDFNQDISSWRPCEVTNMNAMFFLLVISIKIFLLEMLIKL